MGHKLDNSSYGNQTNRATNILVSSKVPFELYLEPTDGFLAGTGTHVYKLRSNPYAYNGMEYQELAGVR